MTTTTSTTYYTTDRNVESFHEAQAVSHRDRAKLLHSLSTPVEMALAMARFLAQTAPLPVE
jgi:hypothetical protein